MNEKYLVLTMIPWEGQDDEWFDSYEEAKKYCLANNLYTHRIFKAEFIEMIKKSDF